jgi:hypothetical protein
MSRFTKFTRERPGYYTSERFDIEKLPSGWYIHRKDPKTRQRLDTIWQPYRTYRAAEAFCHNTPVETRNLLGTGRTITVTYLQEGTSMDPGTESYHCS